MRAAVLVAAALACLFAAPSHAQVGPARNFKIPDPYPPPHQDRLQTLTMGDEAIPQKDGTYLLKGVRIETYRETGETNMILRAPECVFNRKDNSARSAGPLRIDSADGNMHIEGEGFVWESGDTNAALVISNKVHTVLRKQYLAGDTNSAPGQTPASSAVGTNNAAGTNQIINIDSEHFNYSRLTDLITYTTHVQAEDSQLFLTCDVMTIHRATNSAAGSTNSGVETIHADGDVVIVNKADGGRSTGEHAVYTSRPDRQDVVMTGNPRLLQERKEATGKVFIFDRVKNTLRIQDDAYLKLPRDSVGQSGLILGPVGPATNATASTSPPAGTNQSFVEIYSESMLFQMPPTNGPVQKVTAERNVVILDPERNSRGTGGQAVYTEATGLLELSQDATWQADQRLAKGGLLIFDRNNKGFIARTNAYLKLPAASFGNAAPPPGAASTNAAPTNRFVAVLADHYEYRDNVLTFYEQAHAALLEAQDVKGMLDCATLTAFFNTNNPAGKEQLESIKAEGDVYARMLPEPMIGGGSIEKDIKCDWMTMKMRTNDLVEEIVANQNVLATQTQTVTNSPLPVVSKLKSEVMTTTFKPDTNAVEKIVAERNVVITRPDLKGTGQRAVYTASDDMTRLTGDPLVVFTNGTLRGTVITMDRQNNKLFADESKIVITNQFASASSKKPKTKAAP